MSVLESRRLHRNASREERRAVTEDLIAQLSDASPADRSALIESLIVANCEVARAVANRYTGRGVSRDDLQQVAYEGLVRAANRFDAHSGNDFLTFAVPTIRGTIQRHFRDRTWAIRPSRQVQELQSRLKDAVQDLAASLGREPTSHEVMAELGIDHEQYAAAAQAGLYHDLISLDAPASPSGTASLGDLVVDPRDDFENVETRADVARLMESCTERERLILQRRFFDGRTQAEIGAEIGVTQMQVSRLIRSVLERLRKQLVA